MAVVAATAQQFDDFLTLYGYTVPELDKPRLLALSLAFLNTVDICEEGPTDQAQCFIAYAMSANGGGFDPTAVSDGKILTKSGLGRNAIVEEWDIDSALAGSDSISLLKRVPMAYAIIKPLLCKGATAVAGGISNFEVYR